MTQYQYVVVDEFARKYLYHSQDEAEKVAKQHSSELSRSDISVFVLHIPVLVQPKIHHADDVNQFAGERWQVANVYYKGRASRIGRKRFKTWEITKHTPTKPREDALKAAAESHKEQELQEYRALIQAQQASI